VAAEAEVVVLAILEVMNTEVLAGVVVLLPGAVILRMLCQQR